MNAKLAHYALLDLARRPAHALLVALLLTVTMISLVGTLAYSRAVEHRLAYIEAQDLRRVGLVPRLAATASGPEALALQTRAMGVAREVLASQAGVTAAGSFSDGRLRSRPNVEPDTHVRAVDEALVGFLPPAVVEGRWLEPTDWFGEATLERPLAAVASTRAGHRIGERLQLWPGFPPVIVHRGEAIAVWPGGQPVTLEVVGLFDRRDNFTLHVHRELHTMLRVPPFDFIIPNVVAPGLPASLFLTVEQEALMVISWLDWRTDMATALTAAGMAIETFDDVIPLGRVFDRYRDELGPRDRFALVMVSIVVLVTIFGFGSFSAVSAWDRRSEWGVHLATGARRWDILALALWDVAWLCVLPAATVGALVWLHGVRVPAEVLPAAAIDYLRLDAVTVAMGVVVVALIASVAATTPILYLRGRRVVELVRSQL